MMNERIRELANNAGVDAGQLFAEMLCTDSEVNVKIAEAWNAQPDEVRQRIFQVIEQNQSKFAELIVLEMCKELDKAQWDKGEDWVCADGTRIIPQIKQHFGVE
jgi:acyl-CoA reductase-like NAD-dependent aldehyde dehydrogenase